MGKHEIRIRRQRLTARGADRFRNFGAIVERHEQEVRIKKIVRVFSLFAVILIVVMLIIILVRIEGKESKKEATPQTSSLIIKSRH